MSLCSMVIVEIVEGMVDASVLLFNESCVSEPSDPKEEGSGPVSRLVVMDMSRRFVRRPKLVGNVFDNEL